MHPTAVDRGRPRSAGAYRQALALVTNEAERRYLERRLAEMTAPGGADQQSL